MSKLPRSNLAVRHTRMLLIKAGLSEDETDAFLKRLADEFAGGRDKDEASRLKFIERELAEIKESQRKAPGRVENIITNIVSGIPSGVPSAALFGVGKSQTRPRELTPLN